MNPDRFVKVFDIADAGFANWTFVALGLIFLVVSLMASFFPSVVRAIGIPYLEVQPWLQKGLRFALPIFALLWTVGVFWATYPEYLRYKSLAEENRCRVVEGPVEHFVPMPYGGKTLESFSVAGVQFKYSDFRITNAFNHTSSHGGPINAGSYVRICYEPSRNAIIRLEVRDFQGEAKYPRRLFGLPGTVDMEKIVHPTPGGEASGYFVLIFLLPILDLLAIRSMFFPYLRRFLRIGSAPVQDIAVLATLQAGTNVKLRNSMIYWDRERHLIWLRPRGFNLIQIPLTIARLNLTADGRSIRGVEIYLSPNSLLASALFLWAAYNIFSAAPVANGPRSAMIVFLGVATLIGGWINLRILRSRMEKLVGDAVADLSATQMPVPSTRA